jgi:hypothetical protein
MRVPIHCVKRKEIQILFVSVSLLLWPGLEATSLCDEVQAGCTQRYPSCKSDAFKIWQKTVQCHPTLRLIQHPLFKM